MKVVSLNVAVLYTVVWKGNEVRTGIFKKPVEEPVMMRRLNLDGDRQADLTVHGGPAKAVYAYPSEHYPLWKNELGEIVLPWGMFGENLTTEGMDRARDSHWRQISNRRSNRDGHATANAML
jgi:MOSC domain-containing protein YiiM